jgi:hypothetical protein
MKKFFKKVFKGIKKVVKPIGKALKKGIGKISGALGPVGMLALSLMLPGIGAAWAGFAGAGGFASTATGLMGSVMRGIATAGNAVGTVYSSISSMIGGVVKAIPGVGDAYTKLASFTTGVMDKGRMALGLPTSGTAAGAAAAGNEFSVDIKNSTKIIDPNLKGAPTSLLEPKVTGVSDIDTTFEIKGQPFEGPKSATIDYSTPADKSLAYQEKTNRASITMDTGRGPKTDFGSKVKSLTEADYKELGISSDINRDFTEIEKMKINDFVPSPSETKIPTIDTKPKYDVTQYTSKPTYDVSKKATITAMDPDDFVNKQLYGTPDGITTIYDNVQVKKIPLGESSAESLTFDTYDVRTSDMSKAQIKANYDTTTKVNYFNSQADKFVADATITKYDKEGKIISETINPDYTDFDKSKVGLKRGALVAGAATGLSGEEPTPTGGSTVAPPTMSTDIVGATDYSQAYAGAFQGAGYVGPNDFNSFANAGFYGGDPFSIAQYNRRVPTPQANIRIGG